MARTLKDAAMEFFAKKAVTDWLQTIRKDKRKMQFLQGYKTYIVAVALIILSTLHILGIDIPGVDPDALNLGAAIGLIFARNGAKTEVKKIS